MIQGSYSIVAKQYVGTCVVCGKTHGYFQRATYEGAPDGGVTVHRTVLRSSSRSWNESSGNRM